MSLTRAVTNAENAKDYNGMIKKIFEKGEFLKLDNEIIVLDTKEAFIINSSIKSLISIDSKRIAYRMYYSMSDPLGLTGS